MKFNHKRAQSLLEQEKGNHDLNMFLQQEKDVIQKQINICGGNTEVLNSFATTLGVQCAGYTAIKAIGVLEALYDLCYTSSQHSGDQSFADNVFSKAYASICNAAIHNDKYLLKQYIDEIYGQPKLVLSHEAAQIFCQTSTDSDASMQEDLCETISHKILHEILPNSCTLIDVMKGFSTNYAYGPARDAIAMLEAIYQVLENPSIKKFVDDNKPNIIDNKYVGIEANLINNSDLFNVAFCSMLQSANECHNDNLLQELNQLYLTGTDFVVKYTGEYTDMSDI